LRIDGGGPIFSPSLLADIEGRERRSGGVFSELADTFWWSDAGLILNPPADENVVRLLFLLSMRDFNTLVPC
jgi:hypothetical protein